MINILLFVLETVLHANKLSHTDLKPENILFVNSEFEVIDVIRPGKSKKVDIMILLILYTVLLNPEAAAVHCVKILAVNYMYLL